MYSFRGLVNPKSEKNSDWPDTTHAPPLSNIFFGNILSKYRQNTLNTTPLNKVNMMSNSLRLVGIYTVFRYQIQFNSLAIKSSYTVI